MGFMNDLDFSDGNIEMALNAKEDCARSDEMTNFLRRYTDYHWRNK